MNSTCQSATKYTYKHTANTNTLQIQTHCKYKHTANTNTVQIQYKYKHTTNTNTLQIQIQFIQTQYKQIQTQTQTHMKTNKKLIHLYTRTKFGLPVVYSVQCSVQCAFYKSTVCSALNTKLGFLSTATASSSYSAATE